MGCSDSKGAPAPKVSQPKAAVSTIPKQVPKTVKPDNKKQIDLEGSQSAVSKVNVNRQSKDQNSNNDDSSGNTSTNINNSSGTSYAIKKQQQDDIAALPPPPEHSIPALRVSSSEGIVIPTRERSIMRNKQAPPPLPTSAVRLSLEGDDSPTQGSRSSRTSGDASSGSDFRSDSFMLDANHHQSPSQDVTKHYDENHAIYDILDNSNLDEALRRFTARLTSRDAVSMFGISTMYGLGGREFLTVDKSIKQTCGQRQMIAAEQWLRARDRDRPQGSPGALLALCEMYHINGDKEQENECRQLAAKTGFPLAELRITAEKLEELRRSRDAIGSRFTEADAAAFMEKKQALLQDFAELSRLSSRVGARAGKYIWKAYRKGEDGFPRDLHKAAQCLQKAIQYEQGGDDLKRYLASIYAKIQKQGGNNPSPPGGEGKKLAWGTPQNMTNHQRDFNRPRHANGLESPRHRPVGIPERGSNRNMGPRRESYQSVQSMGQSLSSIPHSHSMGGRRESHTSNRSHRLSDTASMGGRRESQITYQHDVNGIQVSTVVEHRSQSPSRRPKVTDYDKDLWDDEDTHFNRSMQLDNARSQDDGRSMKSAGSRRTSRSKARHDRDSEIRQVLMESPRRSRDRESPGLMYSPRRDTRGPPRM
eukprot:TRINITY_DN3830_c0_g1_i1.p1 TRINITY_DN3830_c0_g1~~TRINITY_DN3830_c0_g1_i1.p1  ORF type:complete len:659 (+),score=113.78 TRINITY_DN3830_c0_g1_i1:39-1979(+)